MSYSLDKTSAKILVLGDSGVGKSSLIYLICHSSILSSAQWTIGCSIDVKLHDNCFLEFWDIGGSRSHKIARSFLYQDYHGIMLVFDATNKKSRLNLNEWLAEVSQKTNDNDLETHVNSNIPAITIGTKKDQLPFGSLLDIDDDSTSNNSEHSSIVNFNESPRATSSTTADSSDSTSEFSSPYSSHTSSFHSTSQSSRYISEPLLGSQLIYVNTQDVFSFCPRTNPRNYERVTSFFKSVIERRNRRFYNKFAI